MTDNSSSILELGHGGCLNARQRPRLHLAAGESPTGLQEAWSYGGPTPFCRVTLVLWDHVLIFSFLGNGIDQTISKMATWSMKNNLHPGRELWLGRLFCHCAGLRGPSNSMGTWQWELSVCVGSWKGEQHSSIRRPERGKLQDLPVDCSRIDRRSQRYCEVWDLGELPP